MSPGNKNSEIFSKPDLCCVRRYSIHKRRGCGSAGGMPSYVKTKIPRGEGDRNRRNHLILWGKMQSGMQNE